MKLTDDDIRRLIRYYQRAEGLLIDGIPGPQTLGELHRRYWPLQDLPDGRHPRITSGSRFRNPERPTHNGCDLFWRWRSGDPAVPVGDGGAVQRGSQRRWWYPPDSVVRATEEGVVAITGEIGTGWRLWIEHRGGIRTGYFHGRSLLVGKGDHVIPGQAIMIPGDNPKAHDPRHLHFEVSPTAGYRPLAPEDYLAEAEHLSAEAAAAVDARLLHERMMVELARAA